MLKLYENIKRYRMAAKLSQAELAKRTGYTDRSSIAKIEKGLVDLSQSKIKQFAEALGVTQGDLMGWESGDAENSTMTIGNLFEHLRKQKKLSVSEFAAETGLTEAEIRKYEKGKGGIPVEIVKTLSDYFGISAGKLSAGKVIGNDIFAAFASTNEAYVEQVTKWVEIFGNEKLSNEEFEKLIEYAKFLISQRKYKGDK